MPKRRCVESILPMGFSARYFSCTYFLNRFKQPLSETSTGRVWNLLTFCSLHARASSLALPCQVSTQTTPTTTFCFLRRCNSCWCCVHIYLLQLSSFCNDHQVWLVNFYAFALRFTITSNRSRWEGRKSIECNKCTFVVIPANHGYPVQAISVLVVTSLSFFFYFELRIGHFSDRLLLIVSVILAS